MTIYNDTAELQEAILDILKDALGPRSTRNIGNYLFGFEPAHIAKRQDGRILRALKKLEARGKVKRRAGSGHKKWFVPHKDAKQLPLLQIDLDRW